MRQISVIAERLCHDRHVPGARIRTPMENETRAIVIRSYSTQWPVEFRKLGTTPRRALGEAIEDRSE